MHLPAGLWWRGRLRQDFRFKPMTGEAEMLLADCASGAFIVPARVTSALVATLASVGGQQPSHALVRRLCIADRQFLMRQLAIQLELDKVWITPNCRQCGVAFDVPVTLSALPVKRPGPGFPFAVVRTSQGTLRMRAPDGDDQESIADFDDSEAASRYLVGRCVVQGLEDNEHQRSTDDPVVDADALSDEDVSAVEQALESICPELAISVRTVCPECRAAQDVPVDPYLCLWRSHSEIYMDVHVLASAYHWSESQILALSRSRRKRYLTMVDRQRGVAS